MTHCGKCKAELLPGDIYCASCGAKVETKADSGSPDRPSDQSEHSQTATPVASEETEPVSAPDVGHVANSSSNEAQKPVPLTEPAKPLEATQLPPPAAAQHAEQEAPAAPAAELQARLDQAIQQFTDGSISAETLGSIERTLKPQIDKALAHEAARAQPEGVGKHQPSSPVPTTTDTGRRSATARFSSVQVTLPALASDEEVIARVEQALRDSGEHEAATSYARFAPLSNNAMEHARQWVTIEQSGHHRAAGSPPRRWPQERQAGGTTEKSASHGTQAAKTTNSGSTQTRNQDKRPWVIGGVAAGVLGIIGLVALVNGGADGASASITSCSLSGERARVSGTLVADAAGDVYLEWNFRDSAGNYLGYGNHWVRGVNPGDRLTWSDNEGYVDRFPSGTFTCELNAVNFHGR